MTIDTRRPCAYGRIASPSARRTTCCCGRYVILSGTIIPVWWPMLKAAEIQLDDRFWGKLERASLVGNAAWSSAIGGKWRRGCPPLSPFIQ